jgi:hypothetical protein
MVDQSSISTYNSEICRRIGPNANPTSNERPRNDPTPIKTQNHIGMSPSSYAAVGTSFGDNNAPRSP